MGVYIKDMEMPKDGCHHIICIYADGMVSTGGRAYTAVPVPSHGRLIDADALNYKMLYKENWMRGTGVEAPAVWKKDIEDAPTIIPADEPKEE